MILHCVYCNILTDTDPSATDRVIDGLRTLCGTMPGVLSFDAGQNLDFENKSPDHDFGFVIRFADENAAMTYADDPRHKDLGRQLCDLCVGGADGILVYDLSL